MIGVLVPAHDEEAMIGDCLRAIRAATRCPALRGEAVQVVVALVAAAVHPFTPLAFGTLVPMVGLGFSGLWAVRHGLFPARVGVRPSS